MLLHRLARRPGPSPRAAPARRAGDGLSSMSFWWRRCTRALALAEVDDVAVLVGDDLDLDVARLLDVPLDVDVAVAEARRPPRPTRWRRPGPARRGSRTIFMPRPPPPAAALRMTGKPISRANASASSRVLQHARRLPGKQRQARASRAASRARTLLPISRSISGRGPMKWILQFSQTSANSAFSERKP